MKHLDANRKLVVKSITSWPENEDPLSVAQVGSGVEQYSALGWKVLVRIQEGMKPESGVLLDFDTESEAEAFVDAHPVGSELHGRNWNGVKFDGKKFIQAVVDSGGAHIRVGDKDLGLPWAVLKEAGIIGADGFGSAGKVLDFLGDQRVSELKSRFGENWEAAAEFEYCYQETSHSSAVYLAAACRFHYFVSGDDFSAGYLLRDLEVVVYGIEAEATKSITRKKRAGEAGSKTSTKAKQARMEALLAALEDLASSNKDFVKFSESAILGVAFSKCEAMNPGLWRQGKGKLSEYLGEIRRGDAGEELKGRYISIFGKTA